MSVRSKYEAELALVFGKLTKMCRETELSIEKSVQALKTRDKKLAREVMDNDKNIDAAERDIEQDCLKILLMEHPVASDIHGERRRAKLHQPRRQSRKRTRQTRR